MWHTPITLSYKPFAITFPNQQSMTTMAEPWIISHALKAILHIFDTSIYIMSEKTPSRINPQYT